MFGIGTPELLVILVLALVVVGPERLPELGRTVGRALRELRKVQDEVRGMVQTGIGDDLDEVRKEIRGTAGELRRASTEVTRNVPRASDVTPSLPVGRRGPHRTRRPLKELGRLARGAGDGASASDAAGSESPPRSQSPPGSVSPPADPAAGD